MVDLILVWASDAIAIALEFFFELFLPVLSFDFNTFASAFPFAQQSYYIFQGMALAIATLVGAYHLFPFLMSWFGIGLKKLRSNPIREIMQVMLSVIMIFFGNHILSMIMGMAQMPFDMILNSDATVHIVDFEISPVLIVLDTILLKHSVLLYIILLCMIGWQLVKLLLEAVERYVVLFILVYLSPLASATLASEETSSIFQKYFTMFLSQCLLLVLNIWSLKMSISLFSNIEGNNSPVLALIMGYSFLRIAQRLDSYLNQLGLNAAVTGAGLGQEMLATGASILKFGSGEKGSGATGGILGFSTQVAAGIANFSPLNHAASYVGSQAAGAAGQAANFVSDVASAADVYNTAAVKGTAETVGAGIRSAAAGFRSNSSHKVQEAMDGFLKETTRDIFKKNFDNAFAEASVGSNSTLINKEPLSQLKKDAAEKDHKFSDQMHNLVSNNAHAATTVFDTFAANPNYEASDSASISSVLRGIGAEQQDPTLRDFVQVGYGYQDGVSTDYKLNSNGISARYVKGNTESTLSVLNQSQFDSRSFVDKQGYQAFQAANGSTYYWRATKGAPSKDGSFNRTTTPPPAFTSEQYDQFRKEASFGNKVFTNEQHDVVANNSNAASAVFDIYADNKDFSSDIAGNISSVLRGIGADKSVPEIKEFIDTGYGNTGAMAPDYTLDNSGIQASYVKGGYQHSLSILNETQYQKRMIPEQYGYKSFKSDEGKTYYWKTSKEKV